MTVSDEFVRESTSQLRALSDGLIAIEQAPEDAAALDEAFRTAHSLKGNCAMAGLDEASAVAHAVEDVLSAVRTGEALPEPDLIDAALDGTDTIDDLIAAAKQGETDDVDYEATVETVRETLAARKEADADAAPVAREPVEESTDDDDADPPADLDSDVLDALDTAAEYDDLDELLAAMDEDTGLDEIPDLPEAKSLGKGADAAPADEPDVAPEANSAVESDLSSSDEESPDEESFDGSGPFADPPPAETHSSVESGFDGSGPFAEPEDDEEDEDESARAGTASDEDDDPFASVQAEIAAEEAGDLEELQDDIDAVTFGEFDEDDDLSIDELIEGAETHGDDVETADSTDTTESESTVDTEDATAAPEVDDGGFRFGEDRGEATDEMDLVDAEEPAVEASAATDDVDDGFGTPFGTSDDAEASPEPTSGFDGSGPFADAETDDEPEPATASTGAATDEDDDLFASVQAEVATEEAADLEELQNDIDAVTFGEFDEDDDLSISELIETEPESDAETSTRPDTATEDVATEATVEEAVTDEEPVAETAAEPSVPVVPDDLSAAIVAVEGPEPTVPSVAPDVPAHPDDLTPAITAATESVEVPDVPTESAESTGDTTDQAATEDVVDADAAPVDYEALAWGELQSHAAERSVYRPGMTRAAVEAALAALDDGSDVEAAISVAAHVDAEAADAAEDSENSVPVDESTTDDADRATDDQASVEDAPSTPEVPEVPTDLTSAVTAADGPVDVPDVPTDAPAAPQVPDDLRPAVAAASGDVDVPDVPGEGDLAEEPVDEVAEEPADDLAEVEVPDDSGLDTDVEDLLADTEVDDLSEAKIEEDEPEPDEEIDALLESSFEERETDVEFARDTATEAFESRFGDMFGAEDAVVTQMVTSLAESSRADLFADPADERESVADDRVQSITVDVENAEALLSMVEELTATRFRLESALEGARSEETVDALSGLQSVTANLRGTVMNLRLMPFETATRDLQRLVRDTARAQDKRVSLDVSGREVGLDRSVIDSIGAPLVHIVRNAVDHGIEPPEAREAVGKDPQGSVEVRAERARDGVVIEIEDDGRGIDVNAVRQRVVDNDMLSAEEAADLSPEELYPYVFEPGFSTAEEVTDVSGRGVGMDVVDRVTSDLGGSVTVESTPGEGTTVRLRLPITVAVAEVMFVQSGDERYGIPMTAVAEVEDPSVVATDEGERHVVAGTVGERVPAGTDSVPAGTDSASADSDGESADADARLPLVRLAEAFDTPGTHDETGVAVRLRPETRQAALYCDRVVETREVVIRPFEGALGEVPGLSGATLLGDGELVNIIDVATI
ncbi:ATP-binding protein [Halomarina salina]|uniref:Chemotaxis protein CheA n=1 Tax=Halomarina salina TaxID=1872699 RepID=A0ABD5RLA6_9EURY|nr:ATP-binding protein [Halomarina salina]